jgi:hypothetical protein
MNSVFVGVLGAACIALGACAKSPGTEERKTETTTQTSQGEVKTTSESTQAGKTMDTKTETKVDAPGIGAAKSEVDTVVGTVTKYDPGKKIEVITAEKKSHTYRLDANDKPATVDPGVAVGSRVRVTEQTGTDKTKSVTVKLEG